MIDVWAQSSGVNGSRSHKEGSQEMRAFQCIAQIALLPRETALFIMKTTDYFPDNEYSFIYFRKLFVDKSAQLN